MKGSWRPNSIAELGYNKYIKTIIPGKTKATRGISDSEKLSTSIGFNKKKNLLDVYYFKQKERIKK